MIEIDDSRIEIRDEDSEAAYLIVVDGSPVGRAEYRTIEDRRVFTHTEVDEEYSGMGLANRLVRFALDDMQEQGKSIVPICPFFAAYIQKHPEEQDLLDDVWRRKLGI